MSDLINQENDQILEQCTKKENLRAIPWEAPYPTEKEEWEVINTPDFHLGYGFIKTLKLPPLPIEKRS